MLQFRAMKYVPWLDHVIDVHFSSDGVFNF